MILSGQKDIGDKLREMKLAVALEKKFTKEQILEGYLNIVFFNSDAYGIEAASQYFFSTSAKDLTLPQAALLAGLVNSPTFYNPAVNPDKSIAGATRCSTRCSHEEDHPGRARRGRRHPHRAEDHAGRQGCANATMAPYFCDYISHLILNNPAYGASLMERERKLYRGGLTITTTLDSRLQAAAQAQVDGTAGAKSGPVGSGPGDGPAGHRQDPCNGPEHGVPAGSREIRHPAELQRGCQGSPGQ